MKSKKADDAKGHPSAARLSWSFKTRDFPSPLHRGFGFVGNQFMINLKLAQNRGSVIDVYQSIY